MTVSLSLLSFLLVLGFSFATWLEPWYQTWGGNRTQSANVLTVALGDSRRLFAKHFYVKADAYFHSGYYPSIYDGNRPEGGLHMAAGLGDETKHEENTDFLGRPKDWIDRFSRNFYPTRHRHLGEPADDHDTNGEHHDEENAGGTEREMLPWLRLSAELDPERPETFLVAAYWLRSRLNKVNEAEQFLREGLRSNPGQPEILFELGRIYREDKRDPERARNLWELSLRRWRESDAAGKKPALLVYAEILGNLAKLEEEQQHFAKAIDYLKQLQTVSPSKQQIQKWIDELAAR